MTGRARVAALAARHGLELVGVTTAEPLPEARAHLETAVAAGRMGRMDWMGGDRPSRATTPAAHDPRARSVVVVAAPYVGPGRATWDPAPHALRAALAPVLAAAAAELRACRRYRVPSRGRRVCVVHPNNVTQLAQRILKNLSEPFDLDGNEVSISASLGITLYPTDDETRDGLLKNADTAMYRAKEAGRNTCQFYSAEMHATAHKRMILENRLRGAIDRGELLLHYRKLASSPHWPPE